MKLVNWIAIAACAIVVSVGACNHPAKQVGGFSNDLLGNQIAIEALRDPAIPAVVCHLAYFNRSFLDRLKQGNWFENPSNSAVSCQRTGNIDLQDVALNRAGDEIFSQGQSLLFKRMGLRRVVDLPNRTIVYVAYSRELVEGSAKISMSSVALTDAEAATAKSH